MVYVLYIPLMDKEVRYKQSNYLTNSKYSIKNYQSLALMAVVKNISINMSSEHPDVIYESLLEEKVISIDISEFQTKISKYDFLNALKDLNHRNYWFEFEMIDKKNPKQKIARHRPLISGIDDYKGTSRIDIHIDKYTYGFIISDKSGFSPMEFYTREALPGDEPRRFYDQIRKWESTGVWRTTYNNLKEKCGIDPSTYKDWTDFKKKKLKKFISKIEALLPEYKITWRYYKTNDPEPVEMVEIKIDSPKKKILGTEKGNENGEVYALIYSIMQHAFGVTSEKAQVATDKIWNADTETSNSFFRRFIKFKRNEEKIESIEHMQNKIRKILKLDWGFTEEDFKK